MRVKIAVLDDYQGVAFEMADWSAVTARADVDVFRDHLSDADAVVERLLPYDVVCVMRERTPLGAEAIERLSNLKLIASIDLKAAAARGIAVVHTGYTGSPTVELTWALILAGARHIVAEATAVHSGGWQHSIGDDLSGQTLGVICIGHFG